MLKLKNRKNSKNLKKVLIYGLDGSGKSTFATEYCKKEGLKPICIDIDDTNYTDIDILDFKRGSDSKTFDNMKSAINDIKNSDYDTIVLDGVSSLLSIFISNGRGINKYGDRATRWNKILNLLLASEKNLILIGQITMDSERDEPSAVVVDTNSIVNEKYYTYIDDRGNYTYQVKKYRAIEQDGESEEESESVSPELAFSTAKEIKEVEDSSPVDQETLVEYARTIAHRLIGGKQKINKINMKKYAYQMCKDGKIPMNHKDSLYEYIEANCPGQYIK